MPKILFEHLDLVEAIESMASPVVRNLASIAFRDAAIQLNNDAISLPDSDWKSSRAICEALEDIACRLSGDGNANS